MSTTAQDLLTVATRLFAERGYEGASVRAICNAAGANVNAVSYHFGGKSALYNQVIQGLGDRRLASAQRILGTPPANHTELKTKLLLFAEETLMTWLDEPELLIILFAEFQQGFRNCDKQAIAVLAEQTQVLVAFLEGATQTGLIREGLDLDIVAGGLMERLNSQVLYAEAVEANYGKSIKQEEYRRHWLQQTIQLTLYGAAKAPEE